MNNRLITSLAISVQGIIYFLLAYSLQRENFIFLVSLYAVSFALLAYFTKYCDDNHRLLFYAGLLFRVIFIFSLPNLSQDFYRFIWDGRLFLQGYSPYLHTPKELMVTAGFYMPEQQQLFDAMGSLSAGHYSNYPPLNQVFFLAAALLSGKSIMGSVIVFKLIILLADAGSYYFGKKILLLLNQNPNKIFLYFLNPLVLIELSGNLHFEGVMVFFLSFAVWLLVSKKIYLSAIALALSVLVKLLPLILLPLLFRYLRFRKAIIYFLMTGAVLVTLFIPFLSLSFFTNYSKTLALWFTNFEFNASIYYLFRQLGYALSGYNLIHITGPLLSLISVLLIFYMAGRKSNENSSGLVRNMLLVLSAYLFLSTTVHPWYLLTPLFMSVFTKHRYLYAWSALAVFSYYAYSRHPFSESKWLLIIEYGAVYAILIGEFVQKGDNKERRNESVRKKVTARPIV